MITNDILGPKGTDWDNYWNEGFFKPYYNNPHFNFSTTTTMNPFKTLFSDGIPKTTKKENGWEVEFNIAGTKKKDIEILLEEGNILQVKYGSKSQSVTIDQGKLDVEKSTAVYENGLLTVKLPFKADNKYIIQIE